jgi:hypothetical protein
MDDEMKCTCCGGPLCTPMTTAEFTAYRWELRELRGRALRLEEGIEGRDGAGDPDEDPLTQLARAVVMLHHKLSTLADDVGETRPHARRN